MLKIDEKQSKTILRQYQRDIEKELATGSATEHSFRAALKTLLESLSSQIVAVNEPRREECGAPDYSIAEKTKYGPVTIGYLETKDLDAGLDSVEKTGQLKRYFNALHNLVLTDYLEFRWYVDGKQRMTARFARSVGDGKLKIEKHGEKALFDLLKSFLEYEPQPIANPRDLAERMARITHIIRDIIIKAFEENHASETIKDLRAAFAKSLIPDLLERGKATEFADMFSQTLSYGLFAARCNHDGTKPFRRIESAAEIPKTNPFLRKLFDTITGVELDDEPFAGFVDDLVALLDHADIEAILRSFGKRGPGQDPVIHFYETFLAAYDSKLREVRGVYYTPEPVVSYIVRSVDYLLKTDFECRNGLSDTSRINRTDAEFEEGKKRKAEKESHKVLILDPACGTGTFLYSIVDQIRGRFMEENSGGLWSGYVKEHVLPRLFGFELLMAPYAIAHFKLGMQLAGQDLEESRRGNWAYDFGASERIGVFLTNTLEEAEKQTERLLGPLGIISDEADRAASIKKDLPIMVIVGNPPYSGHSSNKSWRMEGGKRRATFIGNLISDYYMIDGKPLKERNPKWIQNDYVKFIRWGQWRIERTGAGILSFITSNSYLDSPTFRGMRSELVKAFNRIYILNLHGNAKKKEFSPDGSKDENVFDITEGVSISIFVKTPKPKKGLADVFYADIWGSRLNKYLSLSETDVKTTDWITLKPPCPYYHFFPFESDLDKEYKGFWKITDIAPVNTLGFQSHRDHFAIDFRKDNLMERMLNLRGTEYSDEELRERYGISDNREWKLAEVRANIRKENQWKEHFTRCLYRPFDIRECYFDTIAMDRPRRELLTHVAGRKNICINTVRQTKIKKWSHILISDLPSSAVYVEIKDGSTVFPLYLYPDITKNGDLFSNGFERHANLDSRFIKEIENRLKLRFIHDGSGDIKKTIGPDDMFYYIYAVLHSPKYRERYVDFLTIDFPRVPIASDLKLFRILCEKGRTLVSLHLLDPAAVSKPEVSYPITGENIIEKGFPKYLGPGEQDPDNKEKQLEKGRVYISKSIPKEGKRGQYFEGVTPEVWGFYIGGYQVCEKWLKDRRGKMLDYDELTLYMEIVTALSETIKIMNEIDEAIGEWPIK